MSRELLLVRHAKSDWGDITLRDFDRPLNQRGQNSAPKMGRWLRQQGLVPDWLMSSPAQRTRQTIGLVCEQLGLDQANIYWEKRIYEASLSTLLDILAECPDTAKRVLLVGHNPGMEYLLMHLAKSVPRPKNGKLMPTATIAHIQLPVKWDTLSAGCGQLLALQRPRELAN